MLKGMALSTWCCIQPLPRQLSSCLSNVSQGCRSSLSQWVEEEAPDLECQCSLLAWIETENYFWDSFDFCFSCLSGGTVLVACNIRLYRLFTPSFENLDLNGSSLFFLLNLLFLPPAPPPSGSTGLNSELPPAAGLNIGRPSRGTECCIGGCVRKQFLLLSWDF